MAVKPDTITAENVRSLFRYDDESGDLYWCVSPARNVKTGHEAGVFHSRDGYRYITYKRKAYLAHRIVWLLKTGKWPTEFIDHIDCDRKNNRFENLRSATAALNAQNRRNPSKSSGSGLLGVRDKCGRFEASITLRTEGIRQHIYLGRFSSAAEAHAAYVTSKRVLHPGCSI